MAKPECPVKVGMTVSYDPYAELTGSFGQRDLIGEMVTGTVVYVNEERRWFTAVQENGVKTSFFFCEIGTGKDKKVVIKRKK